MEVDMEVIHVVEDDAALALKLSVEMNAYGTRSRTGRIPSKPAPTAEPPAIKKAPATRPSRVIKLTKKASESHTSSDGAQSKRGRPTKASTTVRKTGQRKSVARKASSTLESSAANSAKTPNPDVLMQDADECAIAPSPSSPESDHSSYAQSSSASSHPSPEPIEGHVVDGAEKNELLQSAAVVNNQASIPMQDIPALNEAPGITYDAVMPLPLTVSSSQETIAQVAVVRATRTRRKPTAAQALIGFTLNSPLGPTGPPIIAGYQHVHQQLYFAPPFASIEANYPGVGPPQWLGADPSPRILEQGGAQDAGNNVDRRLQGMVHTINGLPVQIQPHNPQPIIMPRTLGEPPVWADKRQQLCECLPYYNAYQSGVYMNGGIIHAMLIDAECRPHDIFNNEIIITRCGGGRGAADGDGRRHQARDQQSSPIGLAFERARVNKLAIVVIAGSGYKSDTRKGVDFLPHRYNVLAHFKVTDVWLELNDNFQTFVCRLEKVRLGELSWWATELYKPSASDARNFHVRASTFSCRRCNAISKVMFAQGWVCMNINCLSYFKLVDQHTGWEATLTRPAYSDAFLLERQPYEGSLDGLAPLVPPLMTEYDMLFHSRTGTEEMFSKGVVCPMCKCCSRKIHFQRWTCENGCDFTYELPVRTLTAKQAQPRSISNEMMYPKWVESNGVLRNSSPVGHFDVDEFEVRDRGGDFIGYVRHFKSNDLVNALKDGPDDLFREMQEKDFGLMRRPVRQKGAAGEILTSHYASNWGAPYKFVVAQLSRAFTEAPEVIVKALKKMTWAGKSCMSENGPEFQDFNELLSIGYLENTKIGYHDDGEKELGPTIATLSLGSQAVMSLRPKKSTPEGMGTSRNNAKGTKADDLEILLNHGDIIIMHGEKLQKYYEHAVTPRGTLRYALTCRTILSEKLLDDAERAEAARLAKLPEGHESWDYDGHKIFNPSPEEREKAKSKQMVQALQRTLDDLQTMVENSSPEELTQVAGVDQVVATYRRALVPPMAAPAAAAPDAPMADVSDAEAEEYVVVPRGDPAADAANSEDELTGVIGDINLNTAQ